MNTQSFPPFETPEPAITEADVERLVHAFYGRVRLDPLLAPIFDAQVQDWSEHLKTLTAFWSWLLLKKTGFNGAPMPKHMSLEALSWAHFEHWLALFRQTTTDMEHPQLKAAADEMAQRIAAAMWGNYQKRHRANAWIQKVPEDLVSYKVSPVFTHENLPDAFRNEHSTKAGTWGVVRVLSGALVFTIDETPPKTILLKAGELLVVPPQQPHHVTFLDEGAFIVEFHRKRES